MDVGLPQQMVCERFAKPRMAAGGISSADVAVNRGGREFVQKSAQEERAQVP